jgi:hypothetical protein
MDGDIIISGDPYLIGARVRQDLAYEPGSNGVALRVRRPDLGVLHWTAGEGPAPQVYGVLARKRLSIHFIIDNDGVIWQCCDPGLYRCAHAGPRANDRSVGIEVTGYGWAKPGERPMNATRTRYEATIHGWTTTWADYLPTQYAALGPLCDMLSDVLEIPRLMPTVWRRLISRELAEYSGWCGHLHVDRLEKEHPKCDPGTRPLEWLGERWG